MGCAEKLFVCIIRISGRIQENLEVDAVVDKNREVDEAKEAAKRNVVAKMWLNHYNDTLLEKSMITDTQHRKMKVSINSRKPFDWEH